MRLQMLVAVLVAVLSGCGGVTMPEPEEKKVAGIHSLKVADLEDIVTHHEEMNTLRRKKIRVLEYEIAHPQPTDNLLEKGEVMFTLQKKVRETNRKIRNLKKVIANVKAEQSGLLEPPPDL